MLGDQLVAQEVAAEEVWLCKGHAIGGVRLDQGGLSVDGRPDLAIALEELVGVRAEGAVLRLVGYCKKRGGFLRGPRLERREVVLEAVGEGSPEANRALATRWSQVGLRLLGRGDPALDAKPLLVFINPASGSGKAVKFWNNVARKVLCDDADHVVELVRTSRRNHALDMVSGYLDLPNAFKGIVIISGDGLVYEVLQGIMARRDWAKCAQQLPIGVIPGGSGNGMAKSLTFASGLPHSVLAASVVVARMHSVPIDVSAVDLFRDKESHATRVYSILSLEWGMIADVDIGSENMRWLGSLRFIVQFIKNLIRPRKYGGRLSFLPLPREFGSLPTACKDADKPKSFWELHPELVGAEDAPPPTCSLLPTAATAALGADWVEIEDRFTNMWNCNVPWMAEDAFVSPDSGFDDGFMQLQYVRDGGPGKVTRGQLASYVLGVETAAHLKLKSVETTPTRAYRLELRQLCAQDSPGIVAVDGELVHCEVLQMQQLRGLLRIFCSPATRPSK